MQQSLLGRRKLIVCQSFMNFWGLFGYSLKTQFSTRKRPRKRQNKTVKITGSGHCKKNEVKCGAPVSGRFFL